MKRSTLKLSRETIRTLDVAALTRVIGGRASDRCSATCEALLAAPKDLPKTYSC